MIGQRDIGQRGVTELALPERCVASARPICGRLAPVPGHGQGRRADSPSSPPSVSPFPQTVAPYFIQECAAAGLVILAVSQRWGGARRRGGPQSHRAAQPKAQPTALPRPIPGRLTRKMSRELGKQSPRYARHASGMHSGRLPATPRHSAPCPPGPYSKGDTRPPSALSRPFSTRDTHIEFRSTHAVMMTLKNEREFYTR